MYSNYYIQNSTLLFQEMAVNYSVLVNSLAMMFIVSRNAVNGQFYLSRK